MWNLMIVDDQVWARTGLEKGIDWSKLDIKVCASCDSGTQALSVLQNTHVDILLTDIRMAGMDGLRLAEIVSRNYPNIVVVFMSAYQEFEYAFRAIRLGVTAYILKPIVIDELIKTMQGVVNLFGSNNVQHPEEDTSQRDIVRRAKEYVEKNIASHQISLKETAEALHVNYYHLSKCFKEDEKCTFTRYVNDRRLKIACGLLKSTNLNVNTICRQIGMDQKYFHELFNNKMGLSPLAYRTRELKSDSVNSQSSVIEDMP